jgi:serine/threonine protein kinase
MPLFEGTLKSYQKSCKGPISAAAVHACAVQVASGLAHVHSMGIVHRDVHSGNIVLNSTPELTFAVTDFGWATVRCKSKGQQLVAMSPGVPKVNRAPEARDFV